MKNRNVKFTRRNFSVPCIFCCSFHPSVSFILNAQPHSSISLPIARAKASLRSVVVVVVVWVFCFVNKICSVARGRIKIYEFTHNTLTSRQMHSTTEMDCMRCHANGNEMRNGSKKAHNSYFNGRFAPPSEIWLTLSLSLILFRFDSCVRPIPKRYYAFAPKLYFKSLVRIG